MKIHTMMFSLSLMFLLTGMFFLTSCSDPVDPQENDISESTVRTGLSVKDVNKIPESKTFSGGKEYEEFLSSLQSNLDRYHGGAGSTMIAGAPSVGAREDTAVANASPEKNIGSSTKEYSETNVQVEGVDEADIIKTDGGDIPVY